MMRGCGYSLPTRFTAKTKQSPCRLIEAKSVRPDIRDAVARGVGLACLWFPRDVEPKTIRSAEAWPLAEHDDGKVGAQRARDVVA